jgi:methionine-rich copper-binding protein CopC
MKAIRLLATALLALSITGSAFAGPTSPMLLVSDPEDGTTLAAAPGSITLTFSQVLDEHYSRVEVYACGKRVSSSTATVTASQIAVPITKSFKAKYKVFYFANGLPKGATGETAGILTFKVTKGKPCS